MEKALILNNEEKIVKKYVVVQIVYQHVSQQAKKMSKFGLNARLIVLNCVKQVWEGVNEQLQSLLCFFCIIACCVCVVTIMYVCSAKSVVPG